ncbi:hypothetical protein CVT24_011430 [Panaeolus cyanescens]|uniref:CENP-C homolog n=1 Tax=Panaeolus cyanescens TaxID=181874 RepID=A0A409YGQ6_9AGAR|nr:hypothetical protein CVT24_011430 [Panaeolus cyanescens]
MSFEHSIETSDSPLSNVEVSDESWEFVNLADISTAPMDSFQQEDERGMTSTRMDQEQERLPTEEFKSMKAALSALTKDSPLHEPVSGASGDIGCPAQEPPRESGSCAAPQTTPKERIPRQVISKSGGTKRQDSRARGESKVIVGPPVLPVANPEEGWDDETETECVVWDYTTQREIFRNTLPGNKASALGPSPISPAAIQPAGAVDGAVENVKEKRSFSPSDPEEDWDDAGTIADCAVLHYTVQQAVRRKIVCIARMVELQRHADQSWLFANIFQDDGFIAAGQLVIPPGGRKPRKAVNDNTYVFYVIQGAVNFKIHNTSMVLATGGMFLVPRGNTYFIENISNRDVHLFFVQTQKVEVNTDEQLVKKRPKEASVKRSNIRTSSAGHDIAANKQT